VIAPGSWVVPPFRSTTDNPAATHPEAIWVTRSLATTGLGKLDPTGKRPGTLAQAMVYFIGAPGHPRPDKDTVVGSALS